ncbi:hypothetical protein HYV11_01320 [Candidatus Dependentiae bacterium]|nr:hypothetical protein [Candidatus Dependentiae bacterium]
MIIKRIKLAILIIALGQESFSIEEFANPFITRNKKLDTIEKEAKLNFLGNLDLQSNEKVATKVETKALEIIKDKDKSVQLLRTKDDMVSFLEETNSIVINDPVYDPICREIIKFFINSFKSSLTVVSEDLFFAFSYNNVFQYKKMLEVFIYYLIWTQEYYKNQLAKNGHLTLDDLIFAGNKLAEFYKFPKVVAFLWKALMVKIEKGSRDFYHDRIEKVLQQEAYRVFLLEESQVPSLLKSIIKMRKDLTSKSITQISDKEYDEYKVLLNTYFDVAKQIHDKLIKYRSSYTINVQ